MSPRPATVSQADVVRAIRACQKTGVPIARVVVRGDGVSIETADGVEHPVHSRGTDVEQRRELVL